METKKFKFNNGADIRVIPVLEKEQTWFVAADICTALGISDTRQAVERLDEDEKRLIKIQDVGQLRAYWIVSESGLYAIIFCSDKPNAKIFRKWVTSEVLPTIRKTGKYTTEQEKERQSNMKILTKNIEKIENNIEEHKSQIRRLNNIKDRMQKELREYINEDINQLSLDFVF